MKRKALSWLLALCLIVGLLPTAALAAEDDVGGDAPVVCAELDGCTGDDHDEGCPLYVAPEPADGAETPEDPTVEETEEPAPVVSAVTALQERINALPSAGELAEMDGDEQAEVYAEVCAIYDAIGELTNEEAGALDVSALEEAAAFFTQQIMPLEEALVNEAGADDTVDSWQLSATENQGAVYAYLTEDGTELHIAASEGSDGRTVENIDNTAWRNVAGKSKIKKVVVEEGVTYLGANLTRDLDYVEIELPASLTEVVVTGTGEDMSSTLATFGNNAYVAMDSDESEDAYGIQKITVANGNTAFKVVDGVLFTMDGTTLIKYTNEAAAEYTVPSGVTAVAAKAFARTSQLTSAIMNDGLQAIGGDCFDKTNNLKSVTISSTVTKIGSAIFTASAIETLDINSTILEECGSLGNSDTKLKTVHLVDGTTKIFDKMFQNISSLETVSIPASVEYIGFNAFYNCSSLTAVADEGVVFGALEQLGTSDDGISYAFHNCTTLASFPLTKDAPLTEIPKSTFYNCSALTSFVIPDAVTQIEKNAFKNCSALNAVKIDGAISSIETSAFDSCTSLNEISISATGDLTIADGAFKNCNRVGSVSVGSKNGSVTINGNLAPGNVITAASFYGTSVSFGNHLFGTSPTNNSKWHTLDLTGAKAIKCTGTNSQPGFIWYLGVDNQSGVIYVSDDTVKTSLTTALGNTTRPYICAVTNGGTFTDDVSFAGGTLYNGAAFVKDGYIFGGWYSDSGFTSAATTFSTKQTYYAKWIELTAEKISMQYGDEKTLSEITIDGVSLTGWASANSDVVKIENGKLIATGVGTTTITANASLASRSGERLTVEVEVTPRVLTYINKDNQTNPGSVTYPVSDDYTDVNDVLTFKWKDNPNTAVTLKEGEDINYTYSVSTENGGSGVEATVDFLPVPAGTYSGVKFNLINPNYVFANSTEGGDSLTTISVNINVTAGDVSRAYLANMKSTGSTTFTYDGNGKLPVTGTLTAYKENSTTAETVEGMTFNVHIEGLNDTVFHSSVEDVTSGTDVTAISGLELPTKPGAYVLTVSAEDDSYYVYKSQIITITKATITIKADDKSVYVGGAMPALTYTVTGLASGENLSGNVVLTCAAADTNTEGTYDITPSGAVAPSADCYNEIVYETGTLTVSRRSSGGGGGGTTTYAVTVDSAKNGSVSVSPKNASKGTTVTITVKPNSGYELDDLTVTDRNGDAVKLTRKSDTQYTFTMPASKVTVEASFTKIEEQPSVSFIDVPTSAYYYDAVAWAVENGVTNGTSATTFSPDASCTRAQMVTFLWRAAGSPKATSGNPFTDVSASEYYYEAVLWAVEQGITNGTSATTFSPDATVTRGQTVTFLWRAGGSPAVSGGSFADVAADAYYAPAVQWAVANGITNGTSSTTFSPDDPCTRGQIVTFMYRDAR